MADAEDTCPTGVPHAREPRDELRDGLASHKEDAIAPHPLSRANPLSADVTSRRERVAGTYGQAALARQDIDEQILGTPLRLPGLAVGSSRLGMQVLTNAVDDVSYANFVGVPFDAETPPRATVHERMEARLGLQSPKEQTHRRYTPPHRAGI